MTNQVLEICGILEFWDKPQRRFLLISLLAFYSLLIITQTCQVSLPKYTYVITLYLSTFCSESFTSWFTPVLCLLEIICSLLREAHLSLVYVMYLLYGFQLFPERRSNNTTVRVNGSQKDAAFTCPQDRWCQFKPATMQSSSPYNVLQQQQMINAYASSPSLYNWPSLYIKYRDDFHNFLHHSWDPAPERPGNHNLMSSLPATWTDVELDSLWVGVRRHGRGNWEMMLRDLKLQFLPGKTPQDLAERWGEEYSHLLYSRRGYQSSGPVDLLCRRVVTHLCERNGQLQYPVANTATISPYSYFRNSTSMGLFNPYGGNGMPQVDSWSGAGQVNCTREAALLAPRPSRTRPVVWEHLSNLVLRTIALIALQGRLSFKSTTSYWSS